MGCNFLRRRRGFTLVELLVVIVILSIIGVIVFQIVQQVARAWGFSQARARAGGDSRAAFETVINTLRQATLNAYWGYDSATGPSRYLAQSDLHFVSGPTASLLALSANTYPSMGIFFQAPMGYQSTDSYPNLNNLLTGIGFYIKWSNGQENVPAIIQSLNLAGTARYRYRLMQAIIPADENTIYQEDSSGVPQISKATAQAGGIGVGVNYWFTQYYANSAAEDAIEHPLAENVLALIFTCEITHSSSSLGSTVYLDPQASYDSRLFQYTAAQSPFSWSDPVVYTRHCLPQAVRVTMVTADENSYKRAYGNNPATALYAGSIFQNATQYQTDLATFEQRLVQEHILYQVFSSEVVLREGLWTSNYAN